MKDDRETIIAALQNAAPSVPLPEIPPTPANKDSADRCVDEFITAAKQNGATLNRVANKPQIPAAVAAYLREHNEKPEIITSPAVADLAWQDVGIQTHTRLPQDSDNVGVTEILAAAANTGAMLLTSNNRRALTLSLLPPRHIAILHAGDIIPDLNALWQKLGNTMPQLCCLLCGPSRTADIEQTLVIGAHGPTAVHIILVQDN